MNDQLDNSNSNRPLTKTKRTNTSKKSFIDSIFFSTSIVIVVGTISIISIFVMSWYVFSLKDREVQILKAQEWIDSSSAIISTAQEQYYLLNALRDTIPRMEATKRLLLLEIVNIREDNARVVNELNEKSAKVKTQNILLDVLQKEIADAENKLITLRFQVPELEQSVKKLESRQASLQEDVSNRRSELGDLDGQVQAAQTQLTGTISRLKTITAAESDFAQIRANLNEIVSQLTFQESQIQTSSVSLDDQVENLTVQNNRISEKVNSINDADQGFRKSNNSIANSSQQLNDELSSFHSVNQRWQSAVENVTSFSGVIKQSETSISSLTEAINAAQQALDQLVKEAKLSQNRIEIKSQNILPNIEEMTKSLSAILVQLPVLQEQLKQLQNESHQPQSP